MRSRHDAFSFNLKLECIASTDHPFPDRVATHCPDVLGRGDGRGSRPPNRWLDPRDQVNPGGAPRPGRDHPSVVLPTHCGFCGPALRLRVAPTGSPGEHSSAGRLPGLLRHWGALPRQHRPARWASGPRVWRESARGFEHHGPRPQRLNPGRTRPPSWATGPSERAAGVRPFNSTNHFTERSKPMPEQTAVTIKRLKETGPVGALADIPERIREIYDSVEHRAYAIFESNGRLPGRDLEDWLQAESELVHRIHLDIAESDNEMSARAEVPGFKASEIEVSVEPRRLIIVGTPGGKE